MQEPDNLNPFIGYTEPCFEVWSQNYLFLVERRPEDLGPGPDSVAKSWVFSKDGKVVTLKLHDNITWQDGQPLTADDVVFTYNYIIDNQMSAYSAAVAGIVKAVKVDDYTVQLVCDRPKANVIRLWLPILPQHIWSKLSPKAAGTTFRNNPPIIGSGPFQTVEWKRGSFLRMVANDDYFQGRPTVDEIVYLFYKNPSTMVADLKAGRLDGAQNLPPAEFAALGGSPDLKAIAYNYYTWDYLNFNCYDGKSLGNPVLRDSRFRVALDYAIDRAKIASIAYGGYAWQGSTIISPKTWVDPDYHWEPGAGVKRGFDLAKAKSLLDAAGYTDANGDGVREYKGKPITLRLWATSESIQAQNAGKLITGWFRDIGLKIQYEVVNEGVYNDRIWNYQGDTYMPDFDMYIWTWSGYADPDQTLGINTTKQIEGWNEPCWSNPEYDRLYELQSREMDPQKRAEYVWRMQQVMYADNPQSVLVYPLLLQAYNTARWTGWHRVLRDTGPALYTTASQKSYLFLKPVASEQSAGSGSASLWIVVAVVAALVAVAVVVIVLRRRRRAEEA
jgi:peptide/nickel transport system substrate-binding protein